MRQGLLSKRMFRTGQAVPLEGLYEDLWGCCLPLLRDVSFPPHPTMGDSKWSYKGPLGMGLPHWKRAAGKEAK